MKLKRLVIVAAALGLTAGGAVAAPAPAAPADGFDEQFSSPTLDPAWTVVPGARYEYPQYGLPVNDFSLAANPGHLRYTLNPMSHPYGFLNGYQGAPAPQLNSIYGYDPGLEIWRPIGGSSWLLEAKVTYYLPCTNGRELDLFVEFGPGGTGTTAAGFVRSRDTDCVNWGGNNLSARTITQPGTTAGDLAYDGTAESLPIGDPASSTYHLRLRRDGGVLTWSRSTDGTTWVEMLTRDYGTALDGLDQRVTIVGHSWFNPAGSYADWDYITVTTPDPVYPFSGFFSPLDNPPVVNRVKAGAAVPVKFSLGGYRGLDILAAGSPTSRSIACDSGALLDDVEETVSAASTGLSYDPALDEYRYVWKTNRSWAGTCRRLEVTLADGTTHTADVAFR